MPIYAYKCESCAHAKDVLQKISDPLLTVCQACGAPTFKKQLTSAGFQLKGSGWYVTDFKGGAANPSGESDGTKTVAKSTSGSDAAAAPASTSGTSNTSGGDAKSSASAPAAATSTPAAAAVAAPKAVSPSSGA